jgi:hypothetical protein
MIVGSHGQGDGGGLKAGIQVIVTALRVRGVSKKDRMSRQHRDVWFEERVE